MSDVTTTAATATATAWASERAASGTAAFASTPALGVSNKPMVPTAHTWPAGNPIDPVRRHMGRPMVRVGGKRSLYRTHRAIEDDALAAGIVVAVGRLPQRWQVSLEWMRAAKTIEVPHPDDAVAAILGDSAEVSKALLEEAQRVVLRDGDNSRYGVVQAITLVAHTVNTNPDVRFAMETLAGQYMAATPVGTAT